MNQNTKAERLKAMAKELAEMFPAMNQVELTAYSYDGAAVTARLTMHGHKTYASATETMRELGIGVRNKTPYGPDTIGAYTQLEGTDGDGLKVTTYPDELPPCCHIEKVVERIPKTETKDTGEFIEVERVKVVCPQKEAVAA